MLQTGRVPTLTNIAEKPSKMSEEEAHWMGQPEGCC